MDKAAEAEAQEIRMDASADPAIVEEIGAVFRRFRLRLDIEQAEAFAIYMQLLERWNEAMSLTSIRSKPS